MKITKALDGEIYVLRKDKNTYINFTSFENHSYGVVLKLNGEVSCSLYDEQANEFYKAWRAMQ